MAILTEPEAQAHAAMEAIHAARRAAIVTHNQAQFETGPVPTLVVEQDDFVAVYDRDTGTEYMARINQLPVSATSGTDLIRTAAEWALANPVLTAGEIGVESDTGIARIGDGTHVFLQLSAGTLIAHQTAQVENSSTAASVDITGLAKAVQIGHRYDFEARLTIQTDLATSGPVFSLTTPASTTESRWHAMVQQGATGTSQWGYQTAAWGSAVGYASGTIAAGINANFNARLFGSFQPTADGTIQLRFRPSTNGQIVRAVNHGYLKITDLGYVL